MNKDAAVIAEKITSVKGLKPYLCQDEKGHGATAKTCAQCECRCAYGTRLLDMKNIPYERQGVSMAAELLRPVGVSLRSALKACNMHGILMADKNFWDRCF